MILNHEKRPSKGLNRYFNQLNTPTDFQSGCFLLKSFDIIAVYLNLLTLYFDYISEIDFKTIRKEVVM